ncbi:PREDICTED: CAAX prenyl protease 2 isoform X2 [Nelumbo nucifera]|uniref:intramembrane prenyl-peptidase Rce1 n=1 Tax=Nelumbo nucifera TaxID=4432 RepID=A0A1U7ZA11_NELNU|nr:PREDICTED: CAAX prenyl protease 2 isoform X2 [Nelumbo nucifera]
METEDGSHVSKPVAVIACTAMAIFYVAVLYAPTLILRFPPPTSLNNFMIRRFVCAIVSSIVSVIVCALLLPMISLEASSIFGVYGIRVDHMWHAVVFPLSLTSLPYIGSLVSKSISVVNSWKEHKVHGEDYWLKCTQNASEMFLEWITSIATNVLAWRNYFVAPFTEELVFRACIIPLLLCGGFKIYNIIFLSPIFFSLAHLNHFLELYCQQNYSFGKASLIVGFQLGYTVIFGVYASFLFIRTGHIIAPIVAHIFCNVMGFPVLSSRRKGLAIVAFLVGIGSFLWFLFPATSPDLYNDRTDNCRCWHGYCRWN